MDPQVHPDPFHEAMSRGLQRAIQVASSSVTGAQVLVHLRKAQARLLAQRDEHVRRALGAQIHADRGAARAEWALALNADWLQNADLADVARAWGAAIPHVDPLSPWYELAAGTAMRRCEERLRVLHPYAMRHYDRLRSERKAPADAMREAAPFFGYAPHTRDAPHAPRSALSTGAADSLADHRSADRKSPAAGATRPWEHDFPAGIRDVVATASAQRSNAAAAASPGRRRPRRTGQRP